MAKKMRVFFLVALCLAVVAGAPRSSQRIVGGALTTITQYPTVASLLYSWDLSNYYQSCAGTIITVRSILTAAHCPLGDAASAWRVRVGSSYANSRGIVHSLANYTVHSAYNVNTHDNDIAILRTASAIVPNSNVKLASIAGVNYNLADNQVVWAVGWGSTGSGAQGSEQLRHVQIWTVNQAVCRQRYATVNSSLTDNMLCSGWLDVGGRDQCQGDSGGPLYHNGVVVGVCSWGLGCAQAYYPGVNTRISRFTPWIQANA